MHTALDINSYTNNGFRKVCDVTFHPQNHHNWFYHNVDGDFVDHSIGISRSYVYFIVRNNEVVKVGETGNSMLISSGKGYRIDEKGLYTRDTIYPVMAFLSGSKSRLGRYMNGDGTCEYIRDVLKNDVIDRKVSIWATVCPTFTIKHKIGDREEEVFCTAHKDFEKLYLDRICCCTGRLPIFNKQRK